MHELQKRILTTFNKNAFEAFVKSLLTNAYDEESEEPFSNEPGFSLPHYIRYQKSGHFNFYEHLYLTNYYFLNSGEIKKSLLTPEIKKSLVQIKERYPIENGPYGSYINLGNFYLMTNFYGFSESDYNALFELLKPSVGGVIDRYQEFGIGSIDTFFKRKPDEATLYLNNFYKTSFDGIALTIEKDYVEAKTYFTENIFSAGVLHNSKLPLESIVTTKVLNEFYLLEEFNEVLNSFNEKKIEEFIEANHKFILGNQYDRIETQIWLKFPELDIGQRNRRLDVFAHNSISNDWDLFELKRDLSIVTNTKDVPVFTKAVYTAITQVKNYSRLLAQDSVKRKLKTEGIEYFEPQISLIMGKKPQLTHSKWRRLLNSHPDINLLTYDCITEEMKLNLKDKLQFISSTSE